MLRNFHSSYGWITNRFTMVILRGMIKMWHKKIMIWIFLGGGLKGGGGLVLFLCFLLCLVFFFGGGSFFLNNFQYFYVFFFLHIFTYSNFTLILWLCVCASGREGDEMGLVFKRAKVVSLSYIIINFKAKMRMTDRRSCKRVQIQIKSLKYC